MELLNKPLGIVLAVFLALTILPVFMQMVDTSVTAFNTTLVTISSSYLSVGNMLITVVRLIPYGIVVAVVAGIIVWIKGSLGKDF